MLLSAHLVHSIATAFILNFLYLSVTGKSGEFFFLLFNKKPVVTAFYD